jgi:micrococcal nuclease
MLLRNTKKFYQTMNNLETPTGPCYTFKAFVINVVDGDTIDVDIDVGFHITMRHRLRFNTINTAELRSKIEEERILAQVAKQFVIDKLLNQQVIIRTRKSDAFGRYLADIYYEQDGNQICINEELLSNGMAKLYS